MTTFEAILLGIIQGLTEFFPVSSSGHLQLGQHLLGLTELDKYIFFDLICHLGTLAALLLFFSEQIKALVSDRKRFAQVILATLPLFPLVLIMKPIKAMFDQPAYLGYCFLITAALLFLSSRIKQEAPLELREKRKWRDPFIIGIFQAMAILPGISRSGATFSGARFLGWQPQEALTFSFFLAVPAILGGLTLETFQLIKASGQETSVHASLGLIQYAAGLFSSFIIGYLTLRLLMSMAAKGNFVYFVWYCLFIGIATTLYFN